MTLIETMIAAMTAVVNCRTHLISAPLLQPIAIGCIMAANLGHLLKPGARKFDCSTEYIRRLIKERGWRCVKPQGDSRKLPKGWESLRWKMVLRLAYFVCVHEIPHELVINADHTGIMFHQVKGKMWITKEQAKANDKAVRNDGDKRQFTLLATTSAAGETLKHQIVVSGKSTASLPKYPRNQYVTTRAGVNTKGKMSICAKLRFAVKELANIGSFCVTDNHWSDNITSYGYITDVAVPYFKEKIDALHKQGKCKEFGKQVSVLIIDCWWGWLDAEFRSWLRKEHNWLRLIFVPGACTPVAQPMDAGVIAKIKGKLRGLYSKWVMNLTQAQLVSGIDADKIFIPADVGSCKKNLFKWLCEVADVMNTDKDRGPNTAGRRPISSVPGIAQSG